MGGRQAIVEVQRVARRFPGAEIVVEQGARFGQAREGGRERGIGRGGPLEVLDRRAQVGGGAAGEMLLALREGRRRRRWAAPPRQPPRPPAASRARRSAVRTQTGWQDFAFVGNYSAN